MSHPHNPLYPIRLDDWPEWLFFGEQRFVLDGHTSLSVPEAQSLILWLKEQVANADA